MHKRSHSFLQNMCNKSLELMAPETDPQGQVPLISTPLDENWSDFSGFFFFFLKMWGWKCGEGDRGE